MLRNYNKTDEKSKSDTKFTRSLGKNALMKKNNLLKSIQFEYLEKDNEIYVWRIVLCTSETWIIGSTEENH